MSRTGITPANLRALRKQLDMTQERFARHIGVERNTVARWEMGKHEPQGRPRTVVRGLLRKRGLLDEEVKPAGHAADCP